MLFRRAFTWLQHRITEWYGFNETDSIFEALEEPQNRAVSLHRPIVLKEQIALEKNFLRTFRRKLGKSINYSIIESHSFMAVLFIFQWPIL